MAENIIHFNAFEGSLVHDALEVFAVKQEADARASTRNDANALQSFAVIAWRIANEMEQANQPGAYGHWELKWVEKER